MVQRWKMSPNQSMVTEPDGGYVEYEDHLAAIAEKDREIERLKETTIDVWIKVPKDHKWDDGWVCSKCGVRKADWVEADIKTTTREESY